VVTMITTAIFGVEMTGANLVVGLPQGFIVG
jgi:hypothetical protein